ADAFAIVAPERHPRHGRRTETPPRTGRAPGTGPQPDPRLRRRLVPAAGPDEPVRSGPRQDARFRRGPGASERPAPTQAPLPQSHRRHPGRDPGTQTGVAEPSGPAMTPVAEDRERRELSSSDPPNEGVCASALPGHAGSGGSFSDGRATG